MKCCGQQAKPAAITVTIPGESKPRVVASRPEALALVTRYPGAVMRGA